MFILHSSCLTRRRRRWWLPRRIRLVCCARCGSLGRSHMQRNVRADFLFRCKCVLRLLRELLTTRPYVFRLLQLGLLFLPQVLCFLRHHLQILLKLCNLVRIANAFSLRSDLLRFLLSLVLAFSCRLGFLFEGSRLAFELIGLRCERGTLVRVLLRRGLGAEPDSDMDNEMLKKALYVMVEGSGRRHRETDRKRRL